MQACTPCRDTPTTAATSVAVRPSLITPLRVDPQQVLHPADLEDRRAVREEFHGIDPATGQWTIWGFDK
jgi:hypothetical protein